MADRHTRAELRRIAATIQSRRIRSGLTQERFAERAEVSIGTIKCIEAGTRTPSLPMLIRICRALKLDILLIER